MGLSSEPRRLGILGGTFDPIHIGHLIIAEEARVVYDLERVLFVPAGDPYHRSDRSDHPITPARLRVEMVAAAIADNSGFAVSTVDVERKGPTYTVDTLEALQAAQPDAAWWFILGADMLAQVPSWKEPASLLERCRLLAISRPGSVLDLSALERQLPGASARIDLLPGLFLEISATDLRRRVAARRPIRYQVPAAVEAIIRREGLYRSGSE